MITVLKVFPNGRRGPNGKPFISRTLGKITLLSGPIDFPGGAASGFVKARVHSESGADGSGCFQADVLEVLAGDSLPSGLVPPFFEAAESSDWPGVVVVTPNYPGHYYLPLAVRQELARKHHAYAVIIDHNPGHKIVQGGEAK